MLLHLHSLTTGHGPVPQPSWGCTCTWQPQHLDKVQAAPGSAALSWPPCQNDHEASGRHSVWFYPKQFLLAASLAVFPDTVSAPTAGESPHGVWSRATALVWLVCEHHPQMCAGTGSAQWEFREDELCLKHLDHAL